MDGYPPGLLERNVPFLVASGLVNEPTASSNLPDRFRDQGVLLRSDRPVLESREAEVLREYFDEVDKRGKSWTILDHKESFRFRVKVVGRVGLL